MSENFTTIGWANRSLKPAKSVGTKVSVVTNGLNSFLWKKLVICFFQLISFFVLYHAMLKYFIFSRSQSLHPRSWHVQHRDQEGAHLPLRYLVWRRAPAPRHVGAPWRRHQRRHWRENLSGSLLQEDCLLPAQHCPHCQKGKEGERERLLEKEVGIATKYTV